MRHHAIHTIIAFCLALPTVACGDSGQPTKQDPAAKAGASADKGPDNKPDTKPAPDDSSEADDEQSEEAQLLAALDPKVLRATEIAENIERDPENSDDVLARSDLDRDGLDALMYEIAINPELASQYRIARGLK
jgi:hypothetical protein